MTTYYLRPLGLVFGTDARSMIAAGKAGALGGLSHIAFTMVEEITRSDGEISRRLKPFKDVKNHPLTDEITKLRAPISGLLLDQTRLMGIVNVTPDSFSDGGQFGSAELAITHGHLLAEQGAEILDIGGESTRPGSEAVSDSEERQRIMPVIAALAPKHLVSVDTRKSGLMVEALAAGAKIINDVSALGFDPQSAAVVARAGAPVILMHAQGEPRTMQLAPKYDDVALDVYDSLRASIEHAVAAGIDKSRIVIDPGIGFGKNFKHNLDVLRQLTLFHGLGVGLLVGLSRKGFVGALTGEKTAANRVSGSVAGALQAAMMGVHILRVHDVKATRDALTVFQAALDPDSADV